MRKTQPHAQDDDPLFSTPAGEGHDTANLYNRMLKPAMRKARITHGGFHRLRHTCATHLIRNGASASQAQLWLGHHDPGFTARTYVHLGPDDLPDPAVFDGLLPRREGTPQRNETPVSTVSAVAEMGR